MLGGLWQGLALHSQAPLELWFHGSAGLSWQSPSTKWFVCAGLFFPASWALLIVLPRGWEPSELPLALPKEISRNSAPALGIFLWFSLLCPPHSPLLLSQSVMQLVCSLQTGCQQTLGCIYRQEEAELIQGNSCFSPLWSLNSLLQQVSNIRWCFTATVVNSGTLSWGEIPYLRAWWGSAEIQFRVKYPAGVCAAEESCCLICAAGAFDVKEGTSLCWDLSGSLLQGGTVTADFSGSPSSHFLPLLSWEFLPSRH